MPYPNVADSVRQAFLTAGSFHVNGPAALYIGSLPAPGESSPGNLAPLGVSEDGVSLSFRFVETEVKSDAAGEGMPADFQQMGTVADISFKLSHYSAAQLEELIYRTLGMRNVTVPSGGPPPAAAQQGPGKLWAASGLAFRLVIDGEVPIRFRCCKPAGQLGEKRVSRYTAPDVRLTAWPPVFGNYLTSGPDDSRPAGAFPAGVELYDHVAA